MPSPVRIGRPPLHPDIVQLIKSVCRMPALQSVEHGRTLLDAVQREAYHPLRLAPAVITSAVVPVDDDVAEGTVSIRVVRALWADPEGDCLLPALVYVHGACGDFATHERLMRALAYCTGAAVVFVDYARMPDAPWPAAERQVFGVIAWLAACGDRVGVDGTRLALVGDGIGAHIAASAALLAAADSDMAPRIHAQVLVCPILDAPQHLSPDEDKICLPWTTQDALARTWSAYAPDATRSPLTAPVSRLRLLPPTLVVTGERDIAAPHGRTYVDALIRAGAPVQAASYADAFHDFWVLDALADTPSAGATTDLVAHFVADAFSR
ncbi:lipase/esterase [Pandoravirus inopinatum]|uniref:Lipase/esterase n=1 Tax=Pandoravirus inopinatum TaxID=1605721 RepID=A0A0B5J003_9VIRU|nr:lipase/esterase [Pandoravirus inopinatum]AJF96754.1 lipase/esterase [Pandoravirus inopinatum]